MKFNVQSVALRLIAFARLNPQSAALRMAALGLAGLMGVLAIAGIQAIATADIVSNAQFLHLPAAINPDQRQQPQNQTEDPSENSPNQAWQDWGGLSAPANPLPTAPLPGGRFPGNTTNSASPVAPPVLSSYVPRQQAAPADATNFGERYARDVYGNPVHNAPLIVLHETVGSADSAINTFQTRHLNEDDQTSYHTLIRRDGTLVYIVPPDKRAFGAGNSAFKGTDGLEAVKTHRLFPPSVNNFSYHISLETPPDGYNNSTGHSGYTDAQYKSLAWLIARTSVPDERITTHRVVDRSGSRIDPRSFDGRKLLTALHNYPRPYLNSGR